ncbi:hypothetical protein GQ44DRAFT_138825 [Phaeosphaeriaceae sp. PMI808]|nr:hypothetical protein GQ44DRAFT_138825 [Phaeosphaeriaceae sp. PMI808]
MMDGWPQASTHTESVRVVGRDVIKRQENEPPSARLLSSSRSTDCARPTKTRRRRGDARSPGCAPQRWWECWRRCSTAAYETQIGLMGQM